MVIRQPKGPEGKGFGRTMSRKTNGDDDDEEKNDENIEVLENLEIEDEDFKPTENGQ